jgi:CheY-like chemotaxis protein
MKNILLVEDDASVREAYEVLLKRQGYHVNSAVNGKAGLELALQAEPDLILLDIFMPVMNGLEFLKHYKPKEKHPTVKVVMLTNVEEPFYAAMELGANEYIVKADVSGKEVIQLIHKLLL